MRSIIDYDVIVMASGSAVAEARAAMANHTADNPMILVRLETATAVKWHRFEATVVETAIEGAADTDLLSSLLGFDSISEVPVTEDRDGFGVLMFDEQVFGFAHGREQAAAVGPRRSFDTDPQAAAPADLPGDGGARPDEVMRGPQEPPDNGGGAFPESVTAFPTIEAPTTVGLDEEFVATVSLHLEQSDVTLGEFTVGNLDPAEPTLEFDVTVAGPFHVTSGESAGKLTLHRTEGVREPFVVKLKPGGPPQSYDPNNGGVWQADITVFFDYKGQPVGEASRAVRINALGNPAVAAASNAVPSRTESEALAPPVGGTDVTIRIARSNAASGDFDLSIVSHHIPGPRVTQRLELGVDHAAFARYVIERVERNLANRNSDNSLESIGHEIAELFDEDVHTAIRKVWQGVTAERGEDAVPLVLLLTTDASVPWELAWLEIDDDTAGFLGRIADVGRWPLKRQKLLHDEPLQIESIGVMVGEYDQTFLADELPRAEEEGEALVETYVAHRFTADDVGLDGLLSGKAPDNLEFNALHFAGHGENKAGRPSALLYNSGQEIDVGMLETAEVAKRPEGAFLFVNACQVGTAEVVLNRYAGLAGYAIAGGFRGCMAPLWSVADDVAKQISLGFYAAMAEGDDGTAAEYLRRVRENFVQTDTDPAHTTWLAYVYYGHPGMHLSGPKKKET